MTSDVTSWLNRTKFWRAVLAGYQQDNMEEILDMGSLCLQKYVKFPVECTSKVGTLPYLRCIQDENTEHFEQL